MKDYAAGDIVTVEDEIKSTTFNKEENETYFSFVGSKEEYDLKFKGNLTKKSGSMFKVY